MTHAITIPIESAARRCPCLESQFLRSTAASDLGLSPVANIGLALALSLAGVLIWSGSSHGAWRYGAADLGFVLVAAAFGLGALRVAARARAKRACGARQSAPARQRTGASSTSLHARAGSPIVLLVTQGFVSFSSMMR